MKNEKLLRAIGEIDERLIEDAINDKNASHPQPNYQKRKTNLSINRDKIDVLPIYRKTIATLLAHRGIMVACLCLIVTGALYSLLVIGTFPGNLDENSDSHSLEVTPGNSNSTGTAVTPDISNPPGPLTLEIPTSATYKSLEELLTYLSAHDYHNSELQDERSITVDINTDAQSVTEGATVVLYADYAYHIGNDKIYISKLGDKKPEKAGEIPFDADFSVKSLFVWGDKLVLTGSFLNSKDELTLESVSSAYIQLYSLANPQSPTLLEEYTQLGKTVACYIDDGNLYLLTADGICACGWSRLNDVSDYVPQLSRNGETILWEDSEICILGEPANVQYVAATRIDVGSGEIVGKQAFYGDIKDVFYGPQWLAIATQGQEKSLATQPNIYTFEMPSGFTCTGIIDLVELLSLDNTVMPNDGHFTDSQYPSILSVTKDGTVYRLIGKLAKKADSDTTNTELLTITMDFIKDKKQIALASLDIGNGRFFSIDELLWKDNRALISVSTTKQTAQQIHIENHFLFAEFSGVGISLFDNELIADHVDGVEGIYSYGKPFGHLDTFLPMGKGIYLRYNQTPDGLDLYDFSHSANPQCLYKSPGDLFDGCRFDFTWEVYSQDTFGIMVVHPNENGQYRNVNFSWNVYSIGTDMDNPYTLQAEYNLGQHSPFSDIGFATFEHAGRHYYVLRDADTAIPLDL